MTDVELISNISRPKSGMVLAAGLGTRMRPITNTKPKPLVQVSGKTLLDHALDALGAASVETAVVNVHHFADQMEDHVANRKHGPAVVISDERDELMNSGGGVARALPKLGKDPFYLLNGDSFWIEGVKPNLDHLANAWRPDQMDMLLLLSSMTTAVGYDATGDFNMDPGGRLERRGESTTAPFAYAGAAIVNPSVFADAPQGAFNLNILFDRAIESDRLFGVRMDGLWLHVGTPDAIDEAEKAISRSAA